MVIDTQSVLDWLYFSDPVCTQWPVQLQAGRWQWVASKPMREELAHVLLRGIDQPSRAPVEVVLAGFDRWVTLFDPPPVGDGTRLLCSDPDDQKFIDLAMTLPATWLISRDKAVLKLRRRAWERCGLRIVTPAQWLAASA